MNDDVRESVRQWRAKAQSDWTTVEILLGNRRCPADTVCFHCQQFVEKMNELVELSRKFGKILLSKLDD